MFFYDYRVKRRRRYHRHRKDFFHKRHHKSGEKRGRKIALIILGILVLLILSGIFFYFYMKSAGQSSLLKNAQGKQPVIKEKDVSPMEAEEEETGIVRRNGKKYRYNENIINILCMGIDRSLDMTELTEVSGESGQADTIFLLVFNSDKKNMQLIGISRDTMTDIKTYDYHGNYIGTSTNHLGLAFAFGTETQPGGELVADAVSELFYGLPIHGYAAVNLNAIEKLNNPSRRLYAGWPGISPGRSRHTDRAGSGELYPVQKHRAGRKQQPAHGKAETVRLIFCGSGQKRSETGHQTPHHTVSAANSRYVHQYKNGRGRIPGIPASRNQLRRGTNHDAGGNYKTGRSI